MPEFTPINTQEEFDAAIKDRIARERATLMKKYGDYDEIKSSLAALQDERSGFEKTAKENADTITSLTDQLNAANGKVKAFELDALKMKAAQAAGIPAEFRSRLSGDTEEEIMKDAESFAQFFKDQNNKGIPLFEQHENVPKDTNKAAWLGVAKSLKEGE